MSAALLPAFAVVALLLAAAGVAKVVAPHNAQAAIATAGLRAPLVAVRLLGAAELALAGGALLVPGTATALALATAYAAFALFTLRLIHVGAGGSDCGCFGGAGSEAGPIHLALNAIACAICVVAALAPPPAPSWVLERAPLTAAALCIGIAAAAYAAYLAFTIVPRAWRSYGAEANR